MARAQRSEFLAGIFILIALVALGAVLVAVGNWESLIRAKMTYYVRFDQAPMVKQGSLVLLGGMVKGRVTEVHTIFEVVDEATGAESFHFVLAIELPKEIRLRRDAMVAIETKLIGEDAAVNIRCLGVGPLATDTMPDDPIEGHSGTAMDSAVEALGIGEEQKTQIAEILANIAEITASLKDTAPKIERVVDNIETVTGNLRDTMPELTASVREGADKLKGAGDRVNTILNENRENIKTAVTNVTEMTASAKTQVDELLANLTSASADIRTLVAANRMNLSDTLVNMRQTSEQLKAASTEIRRAPWRLLYRPEDREADSLNIFDASRNYANAVADLRTTAATIKTILDLKAEGVPVDQEVIVNMLDRLKAGFKKYEEAEEALWQEWGKTKK